jgi:RNase H-fold protein (predicted Holliday junction resolvase)
MREKLLTRALEKVLKNYQDDKEKLEKEDKDNKAASEILELLLKKLNG